MKAVKILAERIVMNSGERDQAHDGIALELACMRVCWPSWWRTARMYARKTIINNKLIKLCETYAVMASDLARHCTVVP